MGLKIFEKFNLVYDFHQSDITDKKLIINDITEIDTSSIESAYIPVRVLQLMNGFTVICATQNYRNIINDHLSVTNNLSMPEIVNYLLDTLGEQVKKDNCTFNGNNKYNYIYCCSNLNQLSLEKILPSTVQYDFKTNYLIKTNECQIPKKPYEGYGYTYFGTLIDEDIVSVCEHGDLWWDMVSIGIETIPEYRKTGFAASNVTSMTKYLLELGKEVTYSCHNKNIASQKTAESCGFIKVAYQYQLWLNRI